MASSFLVYSKQVIARQRKLVKSSYELSNLLLETDKKEASDIVYNLYVSLQEQLDYMREVNRNEKYENS